ncbi:MAG: hypothetical protein U1F18_06155 [Steroidobacteraceae bacterium]
MSRGVRKRCGSQPTGRVPVVFWMLSAAARMNSRSRSSLIPIWCQRWPWAPGLVAAFDDACGHLRRALERPAAAAKVALSPVLAQQAQYPRRALVDAVLVVALVAEVAHEGFFSTMPSSSTSSGAQSPSRTLNSALPR